MELILSAEYMPILHVSLEDDSVDLLICFVSPYENLLTWVYLIGTEEEASRYEYRISFEGMGYSLRGPAERVHCIDEDGYDIIKDCFFIGKQHVVQMAEMDDEDGEQKVRATYSMTKVDRADKK